MPTINETVTGLTLNRVDSLETYKKLKKQGVVKPEELWYTDLDLLGADIPIQGEEPDSGELWIDTREDGDVLTPGEIGAYTKEETDAAIQAAVSTIPTPDVSGQINSHNTDGDAHSDIRDLIDTKIEAAFAGIARGEGVAF